MLQSIQRAASYSICEILSCLLQSISNSGICLGYSYNANMYNCCLFIGVCTPINRQMHSINQIVIIFKGEYDPWAPVHLWFRECLDDTSIYIMDVWPDKRTQLYSFR